MKVAGWLSRLWESAGGWLLPIALGAVGLLMAHHPMIFSQFNAIQCDLGDSRLINYVLEHSYLWACQAPGHADFWSPPFFFPTRNVGAFSDVLLTVAPIYWALRALGAAPDSAFQGWMIVVSALNYGLAFVLFRWGFRFPRASSAAGAFLVAFSSPRINQLRHQQLVPVFFGLLTLFALARLFSNQGPSRAIRWVWWQCAVLSLVAQLYAGFYTGWFLILALGFCAAWMLALPGMRGRFVGTIGRDAGAIAAALVVGATALSPFLTHYLAAAQEVGLRDYSIVHLSILHTWSWLYVGPDHWVWGRSAGLTLFRTLPMEVEHRVGLGCVTPLVCVAGWYFGRDRPLIRIAALVSLSLILVSTFLPGRSIADLGVVVAVIVAARFYHDRSRPGLGLVVLGALVLLATFERFPSWRVIGLTLFTIILCLAEAFRSRRDPARSVPPVVLLVWLCCRLFDPWVMGFSLAFVAPAVVAIEILRPPDRAAVRLAGLGVWVLFLVGVTYLGQPRTLTVALAAPVVLLAGRFGRWPRVAHRPLAIALIVSLWAIVLLENQDSLWYYIYEFVPGGKAIRAVGRVGLVVLIPAAIGFAAFFATPWARRKPLLAGLIGLCCVVEQGLTTPTYDKVVERARIAVLTKRVEPGAAAFYYRPPRPIFPDYHLDAMWMSLRSGVPTINGYTGGHPHDWALLMRVDLKNGPTPDEALTAWLRSNRLDPSWIQVIGVEE